MNPNISMSNWIPSIDLERTRSDDSAKIIFEFLKKHGYKNIVDFYPEAKFNRQYILLEHSANEILEKIEDYGTL